MPREGQGDSVATDTAGRRRSKRWTVFRIIKWIVIVAILLLLAPYVLVLVYKPHAVKPVSTLMIGEMLTGRAYERQWVAFDDIAPVLVQSVMMSEDGQYCAHDGVDWSELNSVIDDALDGEATRGASTIPMQTVKNLFLTNSRTVIRKGLEIPLAMWSNQIWGKKRTMEIYLNVAEWAPGVFGVEAAAQTYFGVAAKDLTRRQAALLAVTLPNPIERNPANPTRNLGKLASTIQARARQSGAYIKCLYD
ncbi:monofunctional biosynthetic peptidoglycan transglycosylase [Pseudohoeflea suaedae]|uniref:Biosynthetic peptidoglycan transglycosylase n=1 Tax=Pseudohoeflea suaedae TaxID=877384 RepID=A0A4R5PL14_9HYPH|nr:monofunctional biosynthetic peptidoglycan transglycosylase [Pseudohoeflea suaedae]